MADLSDDSDCFESADEELNDENIVKNNNTKFEIEKDSDQPEISNTIISDVSSTNDSKEFKEETGSTVSSMQYRKRPERRKSASKPVQAISPNSKKKTLNEQIFKTDIKQSDALLQDITSNLSKNINKGFSTIQQTSNSIKDLVISSLPVANLTESSGRFSYDDEEECGISSHMMDSDDDGNAGNENYDVKESPFSVKNENENKDTVADEKLNISEAKEIEKNIKEEALNLCSNISSLQISEMPDSMEMEGKWINEDELNDGHLISNEGSGDASCKVTKNLIVIKNEEGIFEKSKDRIHGIEEIISEDVDGKLSHIYEEENVNELLHENLTEANYSQIESDNKDGWDSSELELEELDGTETRILNNSSAVSEIEVNQESKPEINEKIANSLDTIISEDNEGWDDFDIDDDELEVMKKKNEPTESKEKETNEYFNPRITQPSVNQALESSNRNEDKTSGNDGKWSGWDNFGEKSEARQTSGWKLGSWGVNALLNTATSVTQGLTNVIEAGLGVPDPETLARMDNVIADNKDNGILEKPRIDEQNDNLVKSKIDDNTNSGLNIFPSFGITNLVVGVTKNIVENTKVHEIGTKVIVGGLDTLESFGKKTMEVLQEGDPGLKKKRALLLGPNKPTLSQVLREAKSKAEIEDKRMEEQQIARLCHFETLFDDFQGLIHLEALEMLSRQCELKLEQMKASLSTSEVDDLIGILDEVKELCIIDEDEFKANYSRMVDFKMSLMKATEPLKNEISIKNIIQVYDEVDAWLKNDENTKISPRSLFQKAMSTMAEMTAATVAQFHKGGELLSIKEHRKTVEEADALLQMTGFLCCEINNISQKFLTLHTNCSSGNEKEMITKIKEEANNATLYIKDAFNLLIPVLQLGAAT